MMRVLLPRVSYCNSISVRTLSSIAPAAGKHEESSPLQVSKVLPFEDIPGPSRIPLWGNLLQYKLGIYKWNQYHKVLHKLNEKYGPIVREDLGPYYTVIHVFDPDDARTVYAAEGRSPVIRPLQETVKLYRQKKNKSPGLGNTNGEEWYRLRSAVRHLMLQPREVSQYLPEVDDATNQFIARLKSRLDSLGEVPSLNEEVAKWSQESAGRICFGKSLGCFSQGTDEKELDNIIFSNREMFRLSAALKFSLPIYKIFPTPLWQEVSKLEDVLVDYAEKHVNETVNKINSFVQESRNIPNCYSFMSHLIASKDLSKKDITVLTLSMFLDGLSTTVPMLLFNLYNLAIHPHVQEKAFAEIKNALPDPKMPVTSKTLGNLPYLKAVVKESFRTLPNGTDISRILEKDLVLSGYHIPAGTHINLNMLVNFKSAKYFHEPEKFLPERWLRGDEAQSIHPFVLTPFGHGTRTCAGRRFAEQDLYVFLVKILRNFTLSYPDGVKLDGVYHTLIFPNGPVRVRFQHREV
ncbi:probable cytochrome P450 CYP44 [Frankliniella occidentalis]|uniref:Probable cytochrome P450 CYP44 n=1 Tax=Frankliniella occidentalis TaxID=133901 RepID=A0A6J1S103_FRAOC|nr:probable cytochrome P450 CYP44 [Frankliniella occidentalis]